MLAPGSRCPWLLGTRWPVHREETRRHTSCFGELQVQTGVPPEQALMVLVPEAYRNHPDLMKKYPEARTGVLSPLDDCSCA